MENASNKNIVWESCGYFPLFAIPLKSHHYTLYHDSITVCSGISVQKMQSVKLRNIVAKEMTASPLERFFGCGRIHLITWGSTTPNLVMLVKHPKEVFQIIDETKERDKQACLEQKQRRQQKSMGKERRSGVREDQNKY